MMLKIIFDKSVKNWYIVFTNSLWRMLFEDDTPTYPRLKSGGFLFKLAILVRINILN